jgi:hypothetical protein
VGAHRRVCRRRPWRSIPANAPLLEIRTAVNEALEKQRVIDAAQRDKAAKAKAAQNASTQRLFDLLAANDVKIGAPNATVPLADAFSTTPSRASSRRRVVFLYDEHAQSDTIQAMPISTSFREQLDNMFPPNGAEAPWDVDHKYTLDQLELYCVLNQTTQLTYDADKQSVTRMERAGKPKWARVDLALSLHQLFQRAKLHCARRCHAVLRGARHRARDQAAITRSRGDGLTSIVLFWQFSLLEVRAALAHKWSQIELVSACSCSSVPSLIW